MYVIPNGALLSIYSYIYINIFYNFNYDEEIKSILQCKKPEARIFKLIQHTHTHTDMYSLYVYVCKIKAYICVCCILLVKAISSPLDAIRFTLCTFTPLNFFI